MTDRIKIFIADDHAIFRDGLRTLLSNISGLEVLEEAANGLEMLKKLETCQPDIILTDISMPEMDGIEATEKALQRFPDLKIIALTSYTDHIYYYKMIKAGVQGFVLKKAGKEELEEAIHLVMEGKNFFPQDILRNLVFSLSHKDSIALQEKQVSLSKREIEVLELLCQGYTNKEIAEKLHLSHKTVDNHRTNLLSKTGTRNTAHLVMFAIKNHFIEI